MEVDYWAVTQAIGKALNRLEEGPERDAVFWGLCAELKEADPRYDWANAISDWTRITT